MFLAFLVHVFHCLVVLFILLTPFVIDIPSYYILHITSCICLLVHWWANDDTCSLTILECELRGINKSDALAHKFISPIYNINDNTWSRLIYIITFFVMFVSIYKLLNNDKCIRIYNELLSMKSDSTWEERMENYMRMCRSLFIQ